MRARIVIALLAVILVLIALVLPVRSQTNQIVVTDADAVKERSVLSSSDLNTQTANLAPRFTVQYANALRYYSVIPIPAELQTLIEGVDNRIILQSANASHSIRLGYP